MYKSNMNKFSRFILINIYKTASKWSVDMENVPRWSVSTPKKYI